MEQARIFILIAFGALAALAYAPLLAVAYLYILEDNKPLAYASSVGAIICIVVCAWFVQSVWSQNQGKKVE